MLWIITGAGVLLAGGLVSSILKERFRALFSALSSVAAGGFLFYSSISILVNGGSDSASLNLGPGSPEIILRADSISAFFIFIIASITILAAFYSTGYMKQYLGKGRSTSSQSFNLCLLSASMIMVVISYSVVPFLIAWELMSLSSFFLVYFNCHEKRAVSVSLYYLIAMHFAFVFLLFAFVYISAKTGSTDFGSFASVLSRDQVSQSVFFVLIIAGFGTKAGLFPFHSWLPGAHPEAPSHVSALMSGVMIKTGLYGIIRFTLITGKTLPEISLVVIIAGAVSAVYGIVQAVTRTEIKSSLAYSTIENAGIAAVGLGTGMAGLSFGNPVLVALGFSGCLFHILNHSFFKTILFFGAGSVITFSGLSDSNRLGGLQKAMPATAFLFFLGSMSISALPPFSGFTGEFIIYRALIEALTSGSGVEAATVMSVIALLAFVGAASLLCFTRLFSGIFLGRCRSAIKGTVQGSVQMTAASLAAAVYIPLSIIFSTQIFAIVSRTAAEIAPSLISAPMPEGPVSVLNVTRAAGAALLIFGIIYMAKRLLLAGKKSSLHGTWACGYEGAGPSVQYTPSSFQKPFLKIFSRMTTKKTEASGPSGLFPAGSSYNEVYSDPVDSRLITPAVRGIWSFLSRFTWIQNGSMRQYILYGLIYLASVIIWMMAV